MTDILARDLAQEFPACSEISFGGNFIGDGLVVGGLRFLHVGDRNQSDIKALSCLLELSRNCLAILVSRCQSILGGQHVKVVLRYADDQVLLRRLAISLGFGDPLVGLAEPDYLVPAKERLAKLNAPLRRVVASNGCISHGLRPQDARARRIFFKCEIRH